MPKKNSLEAFVKKFIFYSLAFLPFLSAGASPQSCDKIMGVSRLIGVLPVDKNLVFQNKTEIRGFVEVPFDMDRPEGQKIEVFYRIIPSTGSLGDQAPLVVVINGGPGYPSGSYRSYDYEASPTQTPDRLTDLSSKFRILMIDQRGTQGYTAPLSLKDIQGNYQYVSDHFGSRQIAHDLYLVLQKTLSAEDKKGFVIIGQSYGGVVLSEYLANSKYTLKPQLAIFSSAAVPQYNMIKVFQERRREQLRLNLELKEKVPGIELKLSKIQQRLIDAGLSPDYLGNLYSKFGIQTSPEHISWHQSFDQYLNELLAMDIHQFIDIMKDSENIDTLNYILSSSELTEGWTDRSLSFKDIQDIPFENWMVDEAKILLLAGAENKWSADLLERVDQNPPKSPQRPTVEKMNKAFRQTKVVFTFAKEDPAVPFETMILSKKLFGSSGAQFKSLPGGHSAIFSAPGVQLIEEVWKKIGIK